MRYIPTLVGRFHLRIAVNVCATVHPHACGEIATARICPVAVGGTSPRLWGDSDRRDVRINQTRYIPTPVGRFPRPAPTRAAMSVHPHACGEITISNSRDARFSGTSPRLWGDSTTRAVSLTFDRYIPTPVGRLLPRGFGRSLWAVHPHACGEILLKFMPKYRIFGTSPRLWGD